MDCRRYSRRCTCSVEPCKLQESMECRPLRWDDKLRELQPDNAFTSAWGYRVFTRFSADCCHVMESPCDSRCKVRIPASVKNIRRHTGARTCLAPQWKRSHRWLCEPDSANL